MASANSAGGKGGYSFKVVLLGEGAVGKTSLVLRYVENKFNDKHITTLQASYLNRKLNIGGKRVNLAIWDTAGQEKFHALTPIYYRESHGAVLIYDITEEGSLPKVGTCSFKPVTFCSSCRLLLFLCQDTAGQERFHALGPIYYRDSNGAILVYDVTDEDSFQKVKSWVKELRKMLGQDIALCIVGNKIDMEKDRHVAVEEAESYAASVGAKHFHTSAKLNKGIEEMFLDLSKRMIEKAGEDQQKPNNGSRSSSRRNVVTIVEDEPVQQKSGCCS